MPADEGQRDSDDHCDTAGNLSAIRHDIEEALAIMKKRFSRGAPSPPETTGEEIVMSTGQEQLIEKDVTELWVRRIEEALEEAKRRRAEEKPTQPVITGKDMTLRQMSACHATHDFKRPPRKPGK